MIGKSKAGLNGVLRLDKAERFFILLRTYWRKDLNPFYIFSKILIIYFIYYSSAFAYTGPFYTIDFSSRVPPPGYTADDLVKFVTEGGSISNSRDFPNDRYISRWIDPIYFTVIDENESQISTDDPIYIDIESKFSQLKKNIKLQAQHSDLTRANVRFVLLQHDQNSFQRYLKSDRQFSEMIRLHNFSVNEIEYVGSSNCGVKRTKYNISQAIIVIGTSTSDIYSERQKEDMLLDSCLSYILGMNYKNISKNEKSIIKSSFNDYEGFFLSLLYMEDLQPGIPINNAQSILLSKVDYWEKR